MEIEYNLNNAEEFVKEAFSEDVRNKHLDSIEKLKKELIEQGESLDRYTLLWDSCEPEEYIVLEYPLSKDELSDKKAFNYWRMIYRFMDNVKNAMDNTYRNKKDAISMEDVNDVIEYINTSLQMIVK